MASIVGEASSSSPASKPTSSSSWPWRHHVFLSFRGKDTRKGFLGHLLASLERKGITTFKDDEALQKGEVISDELLKAIEESVFAIIILSPNYASSTWCLDELQKIVECNKDQGLAIVPIFYDVEPSDVRYQKGSFEEAFKKHEKRFGQDCEKVRSWRNALTEVANYSGWNSKDKNEAALVESIAQEIHKKLILKLPSCTHNLVGIHSKVESIYSILGMGLKDVRFIGIWGMGGIGKTTIARTVYETIQGDFKVSCFLANVREVCDKNGIVQIQQELVAHVNISAGTFHNEHDGRRIIQNSLCNKKILLVLDDVNEASQLENLAGGQDWFGSGSRIIITTRNLHLLKIHGVHGSYKVERLIQNEALQLFCLNAFKQDQPKEGYVELSEKVVKYSGCVPLALKILASHLCGRTIDIWHSSVEKIRSVQHSEILDTLKISYEDLDSTQKSIFLDIACFFKGRSRDYVIDILGKCGYNPQIEINVLIERSLVTLSEEGTLEMHDLIEELGKSIVIQESSNNPGQCSRLWSKEDIHFVFTKNKREFIVEHMASIIGEASSSSSASTPNSSRSWSWTYHVFLSFRGEDTRKGFLGHLFAALERKGIIVFKDDRVLQEGDVISDELLKAIDQSMFAITVLSPNYATSTWCLDELQRIVQCSKDRGLIIFPIFYDVEPSDVRYQNNSFKKAFEKHEGRFGQDSEKVRKWRDALTTVAGYSGWNTKDEHEAAQVESIAQDIHKKLIPKLPSCTGDFVGIQSQVENVCSLLGLGLNDVRFIGIWGMGGIGKTTLARTVYDAIQGDFKVSCFLANVREVCDKESIVQIQRELVARVNISANTFYNEYDGKRIIRNSLCNKKVLLVMDDVSEESQLKNLVGRQDWFGPGSRIIITTRNMHLLNIYPVYGSYEVKGLNQNEALQLFCMKAFKQDQPKEGYLDLSKEVVKYCAGLPLALEILGSYLCGRSVDAWQTGLRKIRSDQHYGIFDKLKISYDDLDSVGKNIFLDIACFFKGLTRDYIIDILQKCGYNPQIEIDVLIQRSLVTLSEKGALEMHDLVEELGKKIVIQECPNDPGKRSRLWSKEDINFVLTKNKGTEAIRSIVCPHSYTRCGRVEAFSNMSQLKLLIIWGMGRPLGLNYPLPSSLKVLHWGGYPLKTLPLGGEQYEVAEIVLQSGHIEQLWHGKKFLKKLTNLELISCWNLKQMPDLSGLPNLEKLRLFACDSLTEVHPSVMHHKNLVLLDLSLCGGLKTFPGKLEMSSLKELILDECNGLEDLPEFGECMKHLLRLSLKETSIRELPSSVGRLVGLEELFLTSSRKFVRLPITIHELKSLRILEASECNIQYRLPYSLSHVPFLSSLDLSFCGLTEFEFPLAGFDHFPSLVELNLSGNDFVSVPISIHKLPKLQHLWLDKCRNLQSLPGLPSSMRELDAQHCYSLYASESNPLSKAYGVFASPSQDHGLVLQMLITGNNIPSWFVHQQEGNCVSAPLQHDFPQNERLGIALCFKINSMGDFHSESGWRLDLLSGKRLITKMIFDIEYGCHLYILYLSNDYFSNKMQLDDQFELSICGPINMLEIWRSAARWMHKQDIEDFQKSEMKEAAERAKKRAKEIKKKMEHLK